MLKEYKEPPQKFREISKITVSKSLDSAYSSPLNYHFILEYYKQEHSVKRSDSKNLILIPFTKKMKILNYY